MKKSSHNILRISKTVLLVTACILMVAVVFNSTLSHNKINKNRPDGEYSIVDDVKVTSMGSDDWYKKECSFYPEVIHHSETLTFYVVHQDVSVYVGEECVYMLSAGKNDMFVTGGGVWVTVPLDKEDLGKEIRVILTPLYKNYGESIPKFYLGSESAVHSAIVHSALPVMALSVIVVFAGLLILCLAIYSTIKGMHVKRLYALSGVAFSAGVWRYFYDSVTNTFFENRGLLIYNLSVLALMAMAISMLHAIDRGEKGTKFVQALSAIYCAVYIIQLVLQLTGVADLRQTLKLIHATIIISGSAFVIDGIKQGIKLIKREKVEVNFSWLLGVGVFIDLILYYRPTTSYRLVFTLVAILCYTVLEGIGLLYTYMRQESELAETQAQLTLSRTTTMMSQIRSHFVFNILNAISGMCKYDPEMADDTIVRFSRYLRNNIDIMENDVNIPFETDLRQVEDYVALEQIRFGDKVEFYTDVDYYDFMIPPLIIQPVVENAIKHGVSKKQGNGTIILRAKEDGDKVVITVEDDGVGFDMKELDKEKSVGLRNIRFRLQHLVNGTFDIKSEVDVGTTVTITIPKENNNENNLR